MKRTILAATILAAIAASAAAYDNAKAHPKINEIAFQRFIEQVGKQTPATRPFTRYDFSIQAPWGAIEWERLMNDIEAGNAIPPAESSVMGALRYGGYTADLPVIPQSLRHFYDPTNSKEPWLTDLVSATLTDRLTSIIPAGQNPYTSAKGWALGLPPQQQSPFSVLAGVGEYNMYMGTRMPYRALKHWVSIGQTMHLLGDMALPAHVRNDGHPGVREDLFDKWKSDPYENWVTAELIEACKDKPVDPVMVKDIANARNPGELFDVVAVYTNKNFPSQDTLAGTAEDGSHFTNANGLKEYASPQLTEFDGDYFYRNDYAGKCLLARRVWTTKIHHVLAKPARPNGRSEVMTSGPQQVEVPIQVPQYVISIECVRSQAERLVPMVILANERLLEMLMPQFDVQITGFDGPSRKLTGRITASGGRGYSTPRQCEMYMLSGGKMGAKISPEVTVSSDGAFSLTVPDSVLAPAAAEAEKAAAAKTASAATAPAKPAPKAPGSWTAADYFAKFPDDLARTSPPQRYLASPPPGDAARARDYDGSIRSEGGKMVQSFVLCSDPDYARQWHQDGVRPKLSVSGYSIRIEVKECANRAAAETYVKTLRLRVPIDSKGDKILYAEGLDALGRPKHDSDSGFSLTYIDDRFVVTFIAGKALNAPQSVNTAHVLLFKKCFATDSGGGGSTASKLASSAPKSAADAPKRSIRLGVGVDNGGFLLKSEEKEFQY